MIKSLNMRDELRTDTINKLSRLPMYINDRFPFVVSYSYFIRQ
jgi:hypothetical protein